MNQTTLAEATAVMTGAFARSTVVPIDNEPPPTLFVEPPLPGPLAQGVVFIPYRVENLRILPVAGAAARNVSPRVGHLHIKPTWDTSIPSVLLLAATPRWTRATSMPSQRGWDSTIGRFRVTGP